MPTPPLIIASSDMHHFGSNAETRKLDGIVLDSLKHLDADLLLRTVRNHQSLMCGVVPAVITLKVLGRLGLLKRSQTVGYNTSVSCGSPASRVVGYAGVVFG